MQRWQGRWKKVVDGFKCETAKKRESFKKCRDGSDRANTAVIKMISVKYSDGIHQCEVKEYCNNVKRKE